MNWFTSVVSIVFGLLACVSNAAEINVAVASNFMPIMRSISTEFEQDTKHSVTLISGATGKLYAQLVRGAPFDIFLAADVARPKLLEEQGLAIPNSRITYAFGRLVLWAPASSSQVLSLNQTGFGDIFNQLIAELGLFDEWQFAIANPMLAPYGAAAKQAISHQAHSQIPREKIVYGDNINQTYQFIQTGHAELGLIAHAQAMRLLDKSPWWLVPASLHQPIAQQAVMMRATPASQALMDYLQTNKVQAMIEAAGYQVPR